MHRYRIVVQISLILFILNLVLAAPTVVQEIHDARDDEMVVAEASQDGEAEAPRHGVAEASYNIEAGASPNGVAEASQNGEAETSQHATASPQHSLDGSVSSGYSIPYLSSNSDVSGYSWMLERPPRLSPGRPSSLYDSDSTSLHPNSGSMEITPEEWLQGWPLALLQELAPLPGPYPSPPSPERTGSDQGTTEPEVLGPSQHLTSDGSPPSPPQPTAETPPEGLEALEPSFHLTPDESPPSPSSSPTVTPSNNAEFFNKNMMKNLKIAAGVAIVGGTIAGVVGLQAKKHRKHRDFQYS